MAPFLTIISTVVVVLGSCGIFIQNIGESFYKASSSIPSMSGTLSASIVYVYVLSNLSRLYALLDEMQTIVNESKCYRFSCLSCETDQLSTTNNRNAIGPKPLPLRENAAENATFAETWCHRHLHAVAYCIDSVRGGG